MERSALGMIYGHNIEVPLPVRHNRDVKRSREETSNDKHISRTGKYADIFIIATETPREHVNQCVDEIINEIRLLQTQPISGDELKLTLNYITGQLCRSTEISLKLPDVLMGQIVLGHSLDAYVELQRAMRVLTADDLMRVANEYFSIDNILTAVVHGK